MLSAQTPTPTPPAATPPHPELPPGIDLQLADRVIYLCISDKLRPNDIADRLEISLFTVGQIIHSPYGVETRALLQDLDEIRAEIHARHHHMRAMAATADLCETAVREETRRLAAAAIIRGVPYYPSEREQRTSPTKRRSASRDRADDTLHPQSPAVTPIAQPTTPTSPTAPVQPGREEGMTPEEAAIIQEINASTRRLAATVELLCVKRPSETNAAPTNKPAPSAPSPASPARAVLPRAQAGRLLNQLAARMAAPVTSTSPPTRARDAPQAA